MQPTDESLKIVREIIEHPVDLKDHQEYEAWLVSRFSIALDAARQRGKDGIELDLHIIERDRSRLREKLQDSETERKRLASEVLRLEAELIVKSAPTLSSTEVGEVPDSNNPLMIVYTNHRGETSTRTVIPKQIYFGSTEWHPESQWLLHAYDLKKKAYREFAVKDMQFVEPVSNPYKLQRDAALALAAQRGEIIAELLRSLKCAPPSAFVAITYSTPERWLDQQIKRAKAEGAIERLEVLIAILSSDIDLKNSPAFAERGKIESGYCEALDDIRAEVTNHIATLRKEAGLPEKGNTNDQQ